MKDEATCGRGEGVNRRRFLERIGQGVAAGLAVAPLLSATGCSRMRAHRVAGEVRRRPLGKTGLQVSEIGFGGHSWSYKQIPEGSGRRAVTLDEAVEMIAAGMDMGVNFFDSCTPESESSIPGEALKRLKRRGAAIISVRVSHKMKGVEADKEEVYQWTESRLRLWQTDCIDLLMLSNEADVTDKSGYWDMTYSIEALDKLKRQGKIRYTGFGSHFEPKYFFEAFEKFGRHFDVCSMPYNIRHRVAESVMPAAKKAGLGVITIKPFARGALFAKRDLVGGDADLPRDMAAFVLESPWVDICLCGVHTLAQVRRNFSASWSPLSADARKRLEAVAAGASVPRAYAWLENGWRCA